MRGERGGGGDTPPGGPEGVRARRAVLTIRDVARAANVSIGTVSKALNNSGSLRAETRAKVNAVAKELGFRPNDLAQSLHRGQSFTVGLITTDAFGRFSIPIMEGLEECLADRRMSVFMCNAADDADRERRHVDSLLGKRVDGIVVTGRRADRRQGLRIEGRNIPVLYVYAQSDDPNSLCLVPDDEGGAKLATEHLVSLGRTRIAHVTGPERFEAVRLRRRGYLAALKRARVPAREEFYVSGEWSEEWGRAAVGRLFKNQKDAPDAIFCGNDQIARGIADALRERDIGVPREVAIVGFDNWGILAEATRPPLTTIDMNLKELGREAGRRLIDLIGGSRVAGVRRLPCSLVVRESCGAHEQQKVK